MNQVESCIEKPITGDKKSRPPPEKGISKERNILKDYLLSLAKYPLLTAEEEKDLSSKAKAGDQRAREKLILHNLRLVVSIAKHYQSWLSRVGSLSLLDLIQYGNLGLMKTVERFDPSLGFRFSTYATWWIRQSILRNLCNDSRLIRIPVHSFGLISKIIRLNNRAMAKTGKPLTEEQLIRKLTSGRVKNKVSRSAVRRALAVIYAGEPSSLDFSKEMEDGEMTLYGILGVFDPPYEDSRAEKLKLLEHFSETARLSAKEAAVLEFRFGIKGLSFIGPSLVMPKLESGKGLIKGKEHTLEEVGQRFSLTRERVRQIEAKAIRKLQQAAFKEKFIDQEPERKKQIRRRKKLARTKAKPLR